MSPRTAPLSQILCEARPDAAVVAFGRDGERRFGDLVADVAALSAATEKVGAGRWLLDTESCYAAAVGLLALGQTGGVAVLPPNRQPETLRRLADEVVGALVDARRGAEPLAGLPCLDPLAQPPAPPPRWRLDRDAPLAEFRTSGTTGEGRPLLKLLRHLEDEVQILEGLFGARVAPTARVFATISYQHLYGALFRLLWPLATGRAFQTDVLLHPQELFPRMLECDEAVLVTTPVQLKRMATSGGLARVRPVCRTVFSSGGPLEADTARRVAALLGEAPIEILGSTETGGVAQRQRAASERPWTPLPGVRVERAKDGRLRVTSPFVSAGEVATAGQRRFTMGDRAELAPDGTFALLGRADRTVKIGERRLALPEMERDLAAHPAVAEAALFVRPHASEPRVHAAVVLGEAGWQTLRRDGRRELGRALAGHLAARWDPVLLPRLWRYVDELPRNAQGKLPLASLEALFDSRGGAPFDPRGGAPVDPRDRDPILQGEARGADWLERRLEVPDDLVYLEGHFDGQPIVAGVVQLRWVMDAARELLGGAPRVRSFEALKFPELLRPGQHFALRVEHRDRLRFRLYAGDRVFATGRALLAGPEGERP